MAKGISLHIGVNEVSDKHYWKDNTQRWNGPLLGCEADAIAMEALASKQGFTTKKLLTAKATRDNVIQHIQKAAAELQAGDFFFLTYSGHGGQVDDINGDEAKDKDARDDLDETWCLHDKQLLDDELHQLWANFKEGVRILIFSDSCHSGTVSKNLGGGLPPAPAGMAYRLLSKASLSATYEKNFDFYDALQEKIGTPPEIAARVVLFAGCQDHELSKEDQSTNPPGGLFTRAILKAWNFGAANNYADFFKFVQKFLESKGQTPKYTAFGKENAAFESGKPLVIDS